MLVNSNFSICENLRTNNILSKYLSGSVCILSFYLLVFCLLFVSICLLSSFCLLLSHESCSLERMREDFICLYLLETNLAQGSVSILSVNLSIHLNTLSFLTLYSEGILSLLRRLRALIEICTKDFYFWQDLV